MGCDANKSNFPNRENSCEVWTRKNFPSQGELENILIPAPVAAVRVRGVAVGGEDKPGGHYFRRMSQLSCWPPQRAPRGFQTTAGTAWRGSCTSEASCRRTWKDASGSGSEARKECCSS